MHKIAPNARKFFQCPTVPNKHRRTATFSWFFQQKPTYTNTLSSGSSKNFIISKYCFWVACRD